MFLNYIFLSQAHSVIDPSIVEQRLNAIRNLHDQHVEPHEDEHGSPLMDNGDVEDFGDQQSNGFAGPSAGFRRGRGGGGGSRFMKRFPKRGGWRKGGPTIL